MARGFRGVKDDLSEIGRHLLDVACFLAPLIAANFTDSPPSTPHDSNRNPNPTPNSGNQRVIVGALSDLAEFGAGLRSGIARVSSVLKRSGSSNGGGMREEVLRFVRELVKCPDSWIEFPVPIDDHFDMSCHQREHIATVECLIPSIASLRISLCPSFMSEESFWKIYFVLLHPKLDRLESEYLSTQQIVDEMRVNLKQKMQTRMNIEISSSVMSDKTVVTQQEDAMHMTLKTNVENSASSESQNLVTEGTSSMTSERERDTQHEANHTQHEANQSQTTLKYIDRWFATPVSIREVVASTGTQQHVSSRDDDSYSEIEFDDNIALMKTYGISPISSNDDLQLISRKTRCGKGLTDDETSDWHAVEDSSDFEIVGES